MNPFLRCIFIPDIREVFLEKNKKELFIMSKRTGSLSINSENIFPIIKKWLYSDHDIFAREVISNGAMRSQSWPSLR